MNESQKRMNDGYQFSIQRGVKAASIACSTSILAAYIGHRTLPAIRAVTLPGKAFFVSSVTVASGIIAAEQAIHEYNRASTKTPEKDHSLVERLYKERYPLLGALIGGVAAFGIWRARQQVNQTATQKFMGIRLLTQGVALLTVLGTIALSTAASKYVHPRDE